MNALVRRQACQCATRAAPPPATPYGVYTDCYVPHTVHGRCCVLQWQNAHVMTPSNTRQLVRGATAPQPGSRAGMPLSQVLCGIFALAASACAQLLLTSASLGGQPSSLFPARVSLQFSAGSVRAGFGSVSIVREDAPDITIAAAALPSEDAALTISSTLVWCCCVSCCTLTYRDDRSIGCRCQRITSR